MALFGLNWEESKWPGHFSSTFLNFFASKIGVKLPSKKKVPWHRHWAVLSRWRNCHFCQKNAFFGQKKAFFQKVHFIQKWSVTPNTIFEWVKNDFLFSNPKLVFFTEFNLFITLGFRGGGNASVVSLSPKVWDNKWQRKSRFHVLFWSSDTRWPDHSRWGKIDSSLLIYLCF